MGVRASDRRLLTSRTAGACFADTFHCFQALLRRGLRQCQVRALRSTRPRRWTGQIKLRQLPLDLSHRCLIADVGKSSTQVREMCVRKSWPCKIAGRSPALSADLHCGQTSAISQDEARIDIVSCYPNSQCFYAISRRLDRVASFAKGSTARVTRGKMRV